MAYARFVGHVGKFALAVIAIEPIARPPAQLLFIQKKGAGEIHEVEILVAIVVVIRPAGSRPHIFRQERIASRIEMMEANTRGFLDLVESRRVPNGAVGTAPNRARCPYAEYEKADGQNEYQESVLVGQNVLMCGTPQLVGKSTND